jgi:hypothetical protein
MSAFAFLGVVVYVAMFGIQEPRADEGAAARVFQLIIAGQVPIVGFFAIRWIPQIPKQALLVIALQIIALSAPIGLIVWLEM